MPTISLKPTNYNGHHVNTTELVKIYLFAPCRAVFGDKELITVRYLKQEPQRRPGSPESP
jgi:hypothetical protein